MINLIFFIGGAAGDGEAIGSSGNSEKKSGYETNLYLYHVSIILDNYHCTKKKEKKNIVRQIDIFPFLVTLAPHSAIKKKKTIFRGMTLLLAVFHLHVQFCDR